MATLFATFIQPSTLTSWLPYMGEYAIPQVGGQGLIPLTDHTVGRALGRMADCCRLSACEDLRVIAGS
jgi:hypothetical protein